MEGETGNLDCFRINVNAHYFLCYRSYDLTTDGTANDPRGLSIVRNEEVALKIRFSEETPYDLQAVIFAMGTGQLTLDTRTGRVVKSGNVG